MLVLAFDRDWTVDVNPHPRHEAVPLEWVRHFAHETNHAVYAIGNQTLAEEAAIPGVVDVVGRHGDDWERWLGAKRPDGRYERFPTRRERLSLIADLHPDADGYVVVDDIDLGDAEGWDHYHAWEFVPAVERGEIDPALPWVRDPVADGGRPAGRGDSTDSHSTAGITPVDASMVSSFLDDHADAAAFELVVDDGEERRWLLLDAALVQRTLDRPAAAAALRCVPFDPDADPFTVRVDEIRLLSPADPDPADVPDDGSASRRARRLRLLADARPDAVGVSELLGLLESNAPESAVVDATRALSLVAADRPSDCTPAIPVLRSLLDEGTPAAADALRTLRSLAAADPADVAPGVEAVRPYLRSEDDDEREAAIRCLAAVADELPEDVVDAVPALSVAVEDRTDGWPYAVYAFVRVAETHPSVVVPAADTLRTVALDDGAHARVRSNAVAAFGRVVSQFPSIGAASVDSFASLFDADDAHLRNNAVGLVADVAQVHSDAAEPHVDALVELLSVDDAYTRINASGALARVAEDFPASVEPHVEAFVELLTDESPLARENACWALGHLRADVAAPELDERARTDDDEDVRVRASWALDRLPE